jgi:hypothetical protein
MFTKIKNILFNKDKDKGIPNNPYSNDIYIVEYPKSGITWLCFLISNSILSNNKKDESMRVTFYNIQQLVPDIHMSKDLSIHKLWEMNTPRFIKSHHEYKSDYKNIIYLVRDPLSVMISYHKYLSGLDMIDMSFSDFVKSKKYGISTWVNHINSWIKNTNNTQRMHIITYESLLEKPEATLENLFENLGISISNNSIRKSIELSSFSNMKKSEKKYRDNNPFYKLNFVRKGSNNREEVDSEIIEYIELKTKSIIKNLNI